MEGEQEHQKPEDNSVSVNENEVDRSYFKQVLNQIRTSSEDNNQLNRKYSTLLTPKQPSIPFDKLLQQQRIRSQELNNDKKEREIDLISKNQSLKKLTLILLFVLLFAESLVLFVLAFFQGFSFYGFELDLWTLRIIVVASLIQISAMLTIAVQHLFPSPKKQ